MEKLLVITVLAGSMTVCAALLFFSGRVARWERRITSEFYGRRNPKLGEIGQLSDRIISSGSYVLSRRIVAAAGLVFSAALLFLVLMQGRTGAG